MSKPSRYAIVYSKRKWFRKKYIVYKSANDLSTISYILKKDNEKLKKIARGNKVEVVEIFSAKGDDKLR